MIARLLWWWAILSLCSAYSDSEGEFSERITRQVDSQVSCLTQVNMEAEQVAE